MSLGPLVSGSTEDPSHHKAPCFFCFFWGFSYKQDSAINLSPPPPKKKKEKKKKTKYIFSGALAASQTFREGIVSGFFCSAREVEINDRSVSMLNESVGIFAKIHWL